MIRNFFVLSPRGDTILAKQYRSEKGREVGSHERSHTEALFRKIKFWDDNKESVDEEAIEQSNLDSTVKEGGGGTSSSNVAAKRMGDAPPVLLMEDGFTYFHIKRNGLIFGASSGKNVSPNTVLEVSSTHLRSSCCDCLAVHGTNGKLFHVSI
jgi:AP-4 complex subunit mu-1